MGQLPVLEIDGISLHQSKTICRYLAKKTDLYGENDIEAAHIDIAVDVIYDFIMSMYFFFKSSIQIFRYINYCSKFRNESTS